MGLPLTLPPRSICLLRLSALGDVTHAVPVVRAIQKKWPYCRICWIIGKLEHKLLANLESVEFIVFDKSRGMRAYLNLRRALRGRSFDVLLHMQVAARANLASLLIRAPIKLGWDKDRSLDRHQWFINHQVPAEQKQHQVQGFLSFARTLGMDARVPEWNLPVTEDARDFARQYIRGDQPCLLISPCSSNANRSWQADRYAMVADFAILELGMQVVLCGGPTEFDKSMAARIEAHMQGEALNLVAKDTLQQLLGLLARADVVLSPDSGPAHIANALGTPVIGLHACSSALRSGPYNSLEYTVDHFNEAMRKFKNADPDHARWRTKVEQPGVMELITVAEVKQKLAAFHARMSTA